MEEKEFDIKIASYKDLDEYSKELVSIPPYNSEKDSPEKESITKFLHLPTENDDQKPKKVRLYIMIDGIPPVCLSVLPNLGNDNYEKIVVNYYEKTFFASGQNQRDVSPGVLTLKKSITFGNGDVLMEFQRELDFKNTEFQTSFQEHLQIYQEPEPNKWSIELTEIPSSSSTSEQSQFSNFGGEKIPKLISLNRLMLKITDPYISPLWVDIFWWTYRIFTSSTVILRKILERFEIPEDHFVKKVLQNDPTYVPSEQDAVFFEDLKTKIQRNCYVFLHKFIEDYFSDFNPEMDEIFLQFCDERTKLNPSDVVINELKKLFLARKDEKKRMVEKYSWMQLKEIEYDVDNLSKKMLKFSPKTFKETDFANQLTYYVFRLFENVSFYELLDPQNAPNYRRLIDFGTKVSQFVVDVILMERNLLARRTIIEKMYKSVRELRNMNNFFLAHAVYSALQHKCIQRLGKTLKGISMGVVASMKIIAKELVSQNDFEAMRTKFDQLYHQGAACIPKIDIYLPELDVVGKVPAFSENGRINFFARNFRTYEVLWLCLRFKDVQMAYVSKIKPVKGYLDEIIYFEKDKYDEEDLLTRSYECERMTSKEENEVYGPAGRGFGQ